MSILLSCLSEYIADVWVVYLLLLMCSTGIRRTRISPAHDRLSSKAKNPSCSSASDSISTKGSYYSIYTLHYHILIHGPTVRYKIRGIRNLVFYGPPDHPQFYTELLSYPFLDEGVDAEEVSCRVIYSKLDWFRLERIAGSEGAKELIRAR